MDSPTPTMAPTAATPEYISAGAAAKLLHCHIDTVRRYERQGKLRAWRTLGNQRRFAVADLEALLAGAEAA